MVTRRAFLTTCIATVAAPMVIPYSHLMPLAAPRKILRYRWFSTPSYELGTDSLTGELITVHYELEFKGFDGVSWRTLTDAENDNVERLQNYGL